MDPASKSNVPQTEGQSVQAKMVESNTTEKEGKQPTSDEKIVEKQEKEEKNSDAKADESGEIEKEGDHTADSDKTVNATPQDKMDPKTERDRKNAKTIRENEELFEQTLNSIWPRGVRAYLVASERSKANYAEYPVFGVLPQDVKDFIQELESADPACNPAILGVETTSYRLPSPAEWQYAARGVTSAEEAIE